MQRKSAAACAVALALCAVTAPVNFNAAAHEGHGEDATPAAQRPTAPRIGIDGKDLELVAIANGHELTIYIDHRDSNQPADATAVEIESDGVAAVKANRIGNGIFDADADWLDAPGSRNITFKVEHDGHQESLQGTLLIPDHDHHDDRATQSLAEILKRADVLASLAAAMLIGFVLSLAVRPRHRRDAPTESGRGRASAAIETTMKLMLVAVLATAIATASAIADEAADHDHGHEHAHPDAAPGPQSPAAPDREHGHDHAPLNAGLDAPKKLPDGTAFVPKPSQRLIGVTTETAVVRNAARSRELIGAIVPDPTTFGQIQAPMDGKIEVAERGISHVGQKVERGEVLALITPTIPLADLGTMQQLRAEVEGKLIIAEQKLARLTRISNVVAQRDIEDTRAEVNALREQKRVLEPKDVEKIALKAPVGGVISVANVRAGQVVSARDTLFEIVDPDSLWIEASGVDDHTNSAIEAAHALDAMGHPIKVAYIGRAPTLRQQSRPFLFRIENVHSGLAIGSPVKVLVETRETATGISVPVSAVVRAGNGLAQMWVKTAPETFVPRPVRTMPLDGIRTLVTAGIEAGDRVVVSGAELINQIR